jgi:xylulokinase
VIRPSLIWCDQRSQPQVDAVNAKLGREKILRYIANPVLTGFTLPKLLWVRDTSRTTSRACARCCCPRTTCASAHRRIRHRSFRRLRHGAVRRGEPPLVVEMMDGLGLDRAILPRCYESSEVTGVISAEAAELTGLAAGTPVVGGGGDQAASAVGNGIVEPGIVSCTLGTSGVVFAHMEQVAYDPAGRVHTFCHAVRDKWHVMGVTQGAGLSLQWFRNQLAPGADYDALTAEAAQSPRRRAGPVLAALSDGRAHAASRRHRARRLDRPHPATSAPI